ncbi:protein of unknown function [Chryseobacterium sp. JV274]|nr:protein of unknown function [Chryseobacterium sp. JV274]
MQIYAFFPKTQNYLKYQANSARSIYNKLKEYVTGFLLLLSLEFKNKHFEYNDCRNRLCGASYRNYSGRTWQFSILC